MDIIADIRAGCLCSGIDYCPMAELIRHMPERTLTQHKCVEVFKWFLSQQRGNDVDWQESYQVWVDDGLAAQFACVWRPGMSHTETLDKIRI